MRLKHLLLASASGLLLLGTNAQAQNYRNYGCYTDEHTKELELKYPGQAQAREAIEQQIQQYLKQNPAAKRQAGVLKVPVVVHIVTEKGLDGISKAQVENGIEVLNQDFRRTNADANVTRGLFLPYAADMEVEFVLAKIDPNGQPTEGINRVTSFTTNGPVVRNNVKTAAPAWPTDKYFNVWLVKTINSDNAVGGGTILGYAQFPGTGTWTEYGLVMLHKQWGKQGAVPGSTADSDGRTATHEVGHCFNLLHTFYQPNYNANQCPSPINHTTTGDRVGDTPPAAFDTYVGCNTQTNNCQNDVGTGSPYTTDVINQTENYMSYDLCQNMFTLGQKERTQAALTTIPQLVNLTSTSNAGVTGIDPSVTVGPTVPIPYWGVQNNHVCAGTSITFEDKTYNATATSWNWSFPGGTPSTSTQQNPVVTYNTPGVYPVTLSAGNSAGSKSVTVQNFITIVPTTGLVKTQGQQQYVEDFEDTSFPANAAANLSWERTSTAVGSNNVNWEQTGAAAASGTKSIRLRNNAFSAENQGVYSTIISPNIDISGNANIVANFDLAFAKRTSATPGEELKVYLSTDCGATWLPRYSKAGNLLVTNGGTVVGNFTPGTNDWRKETIPVQNSLLTNGRLMFKFEAQNFGGNSIYIDNFRVYTTILGTNEEIAANNNIQLFPNPLTSATGINFELKKADQVSVNIYDLVGNQIYKGNTEMLASGAHTIPVYDKLKGYKAGMYLVQLQIGNQVYNTKLIAQ
ncbi:M43 family zinc metalloprotease [Adhaeribacter soli]|nr:M43 family zinc metalloprotease [Adhaeribacter soli]